VFEQLEDINKIYSSNIQNRYLSNKYVGIELTWKYSIKEILLSLFLIIKLILSIFFRSRKLNIQPNNSLAISWSKIHENRIKDVQPEIKFTYFYNSRATTIFSLKEFSSLSIRKILLLAYNLENNNSQNLESSQHYNTFWYRIIFAVDFYFVKVIINAYRPNEVYIAGLFDRLSILITSLAPSFNVRVHMLQHGVLGKRSSMSLIKVDTFYYMYEFSKPFLKYVLDLKSGPTLIYLPQKSKNLGLSIFKGRPGINIAYASTHVRHNLNLQIIDSILAVMKLDVNLLIYTHPQENLSLYKKYQNVDNIFIFQKERHINIQYVISRFSTIGIEFYNSGIMPIFVNLDNVETDFLATNTFKVFTDTSDFETWMSYNLIETTN